MQKKYTAKPHAAPSPPPEPHASGLGELLRHLIDLVDTGSEQRYKAHNLTFRPRYTPILRALAHSTTTTITELTALLQITQGAVSQTVKLMVDDGLLTRQTRSKDGREKTLTLTAKGKRLVAQLQPHWQARFIAIAQLEQEAGIELQKNLQNIIALLEQKGFAARIEKAEEKQN